METGEYRYFAPHVNDSLFPSPFLIGSRKYLRIFQNKIRRLDPLEYVNNLRPNSKWRPFMITNVRFDVTPTNFPLGKGMLPDYVKQKRSIVSMEVDSHNKPYRDDHCFFRCLAYHRNRVQEKESLLQRWEEFSGKKTVELADMPDLEKCFRVNIHVYELQPDETVIPLFISKFPFENDMYLNRYKNHLSYIKDFHSYARKFTCVACQKMFYKAYEWRRHMKQCKGLTKWEYPGTFYAPSETMFDQIKSCVIGVQDAFFPWFIVYDFEVILQKEPCRVSDKLKWEARHVPVSVCSNVEGFREPRCFVGGDLKKLLKDMLSYMTEIGQVICELALLKWGHILDQIKEVSIREKFETYLQEIPVLGFNS